MTLHMRLDILTIKLQHKGPKTGDTHCLTEVNGDPRFYPRGREETALRRGFHRGTENK